MIYEKHSASRHNLLQSRINLLLGNGYDDVGYGQLVGSAQVQPGDLISVETMDLVYQDIFKLLAHQSGEGSIDSFIYQNTSDNIIAEDTSYFIDNAGSITSDPNGEKKGFADYESIIQQLIDNRFEVHPSQSSEESKTSSVRTSPWAGTIFYEFSVSFDDESHRRHFFNTGGEVRMEAVFASSTSPQGDVWQQFVDDLATVRFNHDSTFADTVYGTNGVIGNYQLTGVYQEIYSASHLGQEIVLFARNVNNYAIQFKFELRSSYSGTDYIEGITSVQVSQLRATGANVEVDSPFYVTQTGLNSFPPLI